MLRKISFALGCLALLGVTAASAGGLSDDSQPHFQISQMLPDSPWDVELFVDEKLAGASLLMARAYTEPAARELVSAMQACTKTTCSFVHTPCDPHTFPPGSCGAGTDSLVETGSSKRTLATVNPSNAFGSAYSEELFWKDAATARLQVIRAVPQCTSSTGCIQVNLRSDSEGSSVSTRLDAAKVGRGVNYGVEASYDAAHQSLFATIQDDDGDLLVNVSDSRRAAAGEEPAFCVFDIGAQITPYVRMSEQRGLRCDFVLTEINVGSVPNPGGWSTASGRTFVYSLTTTRDATVQCGSAELHPKAPLCQDPKQQPKTEQKPKTKKLILKLLAVAVASEKQQQQQQQCTSSTGCIEVNLRASAGSSASRLNTAKVGRGTNYGVEAGYDAAHQSLFATIQDDDGDLLVNVSTSHVDDRTVFRYPVEAFCVFDIGAQITPYLRMSEQHLLRCDFALTETREPPVGSSSVGKTFVYTLTISWDAEVQCGSAELHPKAPLCQDPEQQPKQQAQKQQQDLEELTITV